MEDSNNTEQLLKYLCEDVKEKTNQLLDADNPQSFIKAQDDLNESLILAVGMGMNCNDIDSITRLRELANSIMQTFDIRYEKGAEILTEYPESNSELINRVLDEKIDAPEVVEKVNQLKSNLDKMENIKVTTGNQLDKQWKVYFNELNIDFLYEEKVTLADGESFTPTFYLSEFKCYAQVSNGPLDKYNFDRARQLVIDTSIPLILLNKEPRFDSYEMIVADESEPNGIQFLDINLCRHPQTPEKNEFLQNRFLVEETSFEEAGLHKVIHAVRKARSKT